jgi:hypothetical protein
MSIFNKKRKLGDFLFRADVLSIFLIVVFIVAALYIIFIGPKMNQWGMHEGDIALKNVYAPYDFSYIWGIDEGKTEIIKKDKVEEVPYFLYRDSKTATESRHEVESFLMALSNITGDELSSGEKLLLLKNRTQTLSDRTIKYLIDYDDPDRLRECVLNIMDVIYTRGYINTDLYDLIKDGESGTIVIFDETSGEETSREIDSLIRPDNLTEKIDVVLSRSFEDKRAKAAIISLIERISRPNLALSKDRTGAEKEEVLASVTPVLKERSVEKNELIIEKGKRVTARHIAQISQLKSIFRPGTKPTFFFGILLLFLLLGLTGAIYLSFINTKSGNMLSNTRDISIILLNMLGIIILSDFIVRSPPPSYFIPMASMGMILVLVMGFNAAFLAVLLLSLFISMLIGGGIEVMLVLLVGSVVGIYAVKGARQRGSILLAGLFVGIAKFAVIVCIGLINSLELGFYVRDGLWGIASGIFSGFLVLGLLPVFEHFFKVTTNISLLELSDLNHPLLKKLAMEAPGTYHHSIIVGNLAEAACDAIGANSLLARVGSYYHDIGKIAKAEYFTENEMKGGSRHSNLAPSMSALIISKHVKEGIDLAKKYNLNKAIIDFIAQHHGTSLIAYFYQKALEKSENAEEIKEEDFRYPGPRPQTKESAIIMMADAVEASSRTLDAPTPSSIRNLVRKIVNNKFIDGQLDECNLSLKDMHEIADSFVRILMGVFHTRPEYPAEIGKKMNGRNGKSNDLLRKPKQKKKD